ncbi:hypothetical protein GGQ57_005160 [Parabacteroides faecis]|uniref:Transmembrane protein n=1 Tax=Parabacteroides faecis TaxID=1217282 RepID=A0ABR6KUW2_9BACT|nr:hypothetical protein [Parabacteroides faecis]
MNDCYKFIFDNAKLARLVKAVVTISGKFVPILLILDIHILRRFVFIIIVFRCFGLPHRFVTGTLPGRIAGRINNSYLHFAILSS